MIHPLTAQPRPTVFIDCTRDDLDSDAPDPALPPLITMIRYSLTSTIALDRKRRARLSLTWRPLVIARSLALPDLRTYSSLDHECDQAVFAFSTYNNDAVMNGQTDRQTDRHRRTSPFSTAIASGK